MARTDWNLHREQFERYKSENPALSLAQYCENNGLNYQTARRHIKTREAAQKGKKMRTAKTAQTETKTRNSNSAQKEQSKKTRKSNNTSDSKGCKRKVSDKKEGNSALSPSDSNPKYQKNAKFQEGKSDTPDSAMPSDRQQKNKKTGFERPVKARRLAAPFKKGNTVAMKHGGYARLESIDDDLQETALRLAGEDAGFIEVTAIARILQMDRIAGELAREAEDLNDFYQQLRETKPGEVAPEVIQMLESTPSTAKRIADIQFGLNERIASMMMMGVTAKSNRIKDYAKQHEIHPFSAVERVAMADELFEQIDAEGLQPVEATRLFERSGLKVPDILAAEAKKEISMRELEVGNDGGMSEEEVKAEEEKFIEKMASITEEIARREREVTEAMEAQIQEEILQDSDDDWQSFDDFSSELQAADYEESEDSDADLLDSQDFDSGYDE